MIRMCIQTFSCFAALLTLSLGATPVCADEPLPETISFNRDIRPIFSDTCFVCHGPDAKHRKAKLRMDVEADAKADHDGYTPIVPGNLAKSEAWRLINADESERMPPPKSNKVLTARQKALIGKWIEQGAKYEGHWAFIAPTKPDLPKVTHEKWVRNPIDHFVLARLEAAGLTPSPEANRDALIRRVSYDLTGVPPTLDELDRFTTDKSPNWYEAMVDYYFAKPAYGERMALAWMDAARYGDTSVFHADGPRDMWPWRDWVIKAYNGNMPFNQFAIEQIAGDLIPDADVYQQIASGFNRNNGTTDEGGAIAEEYRVEYVVDRVQTTANVFMGVSMECAQCHDHKYDAISQKEYYGFYAFFNQTTDPGMQTRKGNQTPVVNVPDVEQEARAAELQKQVDAKDKLIAAHIKSIEPAFNDWVTEMSFKAVAGEKPPMPEDMILHFALDENKGKEARDAIGKHKGVVKGKEKWEAGQFGSAFRIDRSNWIDFGKDLANFDRTDSFSFGCWVKPDDAGNGVPLAKMDDGAGYRGWDIYITGGNVAVHIIHSWPGDALKVTTKGKIKPKEWNHVFATYDGSSKPDGIKIYINGKEEPWNIEQGNLRSTTKGNAPLQIGRRHPGSPFAGLVDDVRIYERALSGAEVGALAGSDPIQPILALQPEKRTKEQVNTLRQHYLGTIDKDYSRLNAEKAKLEAEIQGLKKSKVTVMVMGEQPKPRETYVLMRGHYASPDKSEVIQPDVPSLFPRLPEGAPRNRLGLAKWFFLPDHPLTARVTVNRYWTMLFGKGIVETAMDFGGQGSWPSHPELLDWLAVDFRENGWNVKRTLKQIMMSATYRQTSRVTPELREKDPQNLLLSRGPRHRLQGDFIRDTALSVSGLLVDEVGGAGVKPYQPPGLWNEVSLDGGLRFVMDKGDKIYRKSMYIYWKRSAPHPGMMLFDAPTREKCTVQRPITNTPLQAMYMMNDTQFVEASRVLAERMMTQGGKTPVDRIAFAYRLATSRQPSASAVATLQSLYEEELVRYKAAPDKAKALLTIGEFKRDEKLDAAEHAAWTIVASTILNMDATVTKY